MSDMFDYAEQVYQDALEEDAYYREEDREIEEAQREEAQKREAFPLSDGSCSRCGRDAYLPGAMGGCFCV